VFGEPRGLLEHGVDRRLVRLGPSNHRPFAGDQPSLSDAGDFDNTLGVPGRDLLHACLRFPCPHRFVGHADGVGELFSPVRSGIPSVFSGLLYPQV